MKLRILHLCGDKYGDVGVGVFLQRKEILVCGGRAVNVQKMGYRNVTSMGGEWRGWTESGYPVIKD